MRSHYLAERRKIAEKVYQRLVEVFRTSDFTEWVANTNTYPDAFENIVNFFESVNQNIDFEQRASRVETDDYYDVVPPYSSGFAPYLGYKLSTIKPVDVGVVLDEKFPNPDILDCDYIDDIIAEIQTNVEDGYGYDPGQPDGIDYRMSAERIINQNIESTFRWLVRHRTRLSRAPIEPAQTAAAFTSNAIPVPLPWLGQVADLAEILHRLERGGTINLKSYFEKGGKGIDLCRGFINIFLFREEKAVDNLNGYISHLKKALGPGEIDWEVMRKIGRKRGGKMDDVFPRETS